MTSPKENDPMSDTAKAVTLYHPDGREYVTSDATEVTRLKAHGYTETSPKASSKSPTK